MPEARDEKKRGSFKISRVLSPSIWKDDDHLSRALLSQSLLRPTQDFWKGYFPTPDDFKASVTSLLFGLSPSGVCHAPLVASGPVVSYTAVSPLLRKLPHGAVSFLWHFPSNKPWGLLSFELRSAFTLWSSDFPPQPIEIRQKRSSPESTAQERAK